ncbi:DUF3857 domain-containing transglutaminase family protein [Candidatus Bipolaricaulota bacterium]|nr:DUF3857 domain-containing transglutaminase family protein [Candidatus Bipolaricaulota bacterium]
MRETYNISSKKLLVIFSLSFILVLSGLVTFAGPQPAETILERAPTRDEYPDSDAVIMLDKGVVEIGSKANKTMTITRQIKIFNKEGRQRFGEVPIRYLAQSGEPKLNWARTITPEGEVIKPGKDDIRDVTPERFQQYPMYSDLKKKVISMPGLTNGAIIEYSYTLKPKKFFLKKDFSSGWNFRSKQPVMESYFEVSFPSEIDVGWTDFGANLPPTVEEEANKKTLIWEREDLPKIIEEPGMPPISRISERVLVTSIESWEYYSRQFWDLAKNRAKPDKAIREKVKELTRDLKGKEKKVRALYNYVATKIRYVAIELGRGKIQPHKASEVFHNKYGDCKDKATLLISMLKVAGIKAHPVLILSGLNEKTMFEEPPPGRGLNHAIVAVEMNGGLKFLDPTCDVCPYEYLPDTDRSKKALAIIPRKDKVGKIVEVDKFDPEKSRVKVDQDVEISEEGDLKTSIEISHSGYYSYYLKSVLESYSQVRQKQIYRGILSQHESGAQLRDFSHSDLEKIDERLDIHLSYEKSGYADTLGDSLIFQTPPTLRIPLNRYYDELISLPVDERKYPIQMIPAILYERITVSFPEGREIVAPDGIEKETEWALYHSSYEVTGKGELTIIRKLRKKKSLLPLEEYPEFKELINKMRKDQQSNLQLKG